MNYLVLFSDIALLYILSIFAFTNKNIDMYNSETKKERIQPNMTFFSMPMVAYSICYYFQSTLFTQNLTLRAYFFDTSFNKSCLSDSFEASLCTLYYTS